jgi:hypothetical protein
MIKKIISILLISLLVLGSIGSVCATIEDFDSDADVYIGEQFTPVSFADRFDPGTGLWSWKDAEIILTQSWLFSFVSKGAGVGYTVYEATKVGKWDYDLETYGTDLRYHVHLRVHGRKTDLSMINEPSITPSNNLGGTFQSCLHDPSLRGDYLDTYRNAGYNVIVENLNKSTNLMYDLYPTMIDYRNNATICDTSGFNIPLERNTAYKLTYLVTPHTEGDVIGAGGLTKILYT